MPGIEYLPAGGGGGGGTGPQGPRGYSILHGKGAPAPALGNDEEFYYDEEAKEFYGPKTAGTWGVGFAMKGEKGTTGEKGEKGTTGTTGEKGEFTFRGAYNAGTTYAKGDVTREAGTSYASIKSANTGHTPSALGEWWEVLAEKGAEGGGGGALEYVAVEALNANVENEGGGAGFAPIRVATSAAGTTYLTGAGKAKIVIGVGTTLFTLPLAHRPAFKKLILLTMTTATPARLEILTNGEVKIAGATSIGEGVTFSVDETSFSHSH